MKYAANSSALDSSLNLEESSTRHVSCVSSGYCKFIARAASDYLFVSKGSMAYVSSSVNHINLAVKSNASSPDYFVTSSSPYTLSEISQSNDNQIYFSVLATFIGTVYCDWSKQ